MELPAPLPGDARARSRLVRKIKIICDRVVRGRHATARWQVKFHRVLRLGSIVLSALGGAGLIATNAKPDFAGGSGWAAAGSLISLVSGILLQISNEFGIEATALQARSAAEAYHLVETSLEIVLVEDNPIKLVNRLLEETNALLQRYHAVMPKSSPAFDKEVEELVQGLVQKHGDDWNLPPDRRLRRP